MRGTGFLREWEIARPSTESFVCFTGDEHIFRIAKAGKDSTIAAAGAGGSYHVIYPTGSGMRSADMSDVFGADNSWILAQISRNVAGTANLGRTSVGVMDTLTAVGDPDLSFQCYWGIAKVIGDDIELSTYRTLCSRSAGANWYIGERHHLLVDRRTIHRDNRPY
jgi:hypothetical protein